MSGLSEREKAIRQRLKDDFEHYAAKCLKIRPKHLEGERSGPSISRAKRSPA